MVGGRHKKAVNVWVFGGRAGARATDQKNMVPQITRISSCYLVHLLLHHRRNLPDAQRRILPLLSRPLPRRRQPLHQRPQHPHGRLAPQHPRIQHGHQRDKGRGARAPVHQARLQRQRALHGRVEDGLPAAAPNRLLGGGSGVEEARGVGGGLGACGGGSDLFGYWVVGIGWLMDPILLEWPPHAAMYQSTITPLHPYRTTAGAPPRPRPGSHRRPPQSPPSDRPRRRLRPPAT